MHIPSGECITHTTNKNINKTTLQFLEKVTINSSASSTAHPTAAQTEIVVPHFSPRQTKSKHKRSAAIPTIVAKAAKLAEELVAIQAIREKVGAAKQRQAIDVANKTKKKAATSGPLQSSPPKFKILRRGLPTRSRQASTSTQPANKPSDILNTKLIMSLEETSKIMPQEYESIFHDLPAT